MSCHVAKDLKTAPRGQPARTQPRITKEMNSASNLDELGKDPERTQAEGTWIPALETLKRKSRSIEF